MENEGRGPSRVRKGNCSGNGVGDKEKGRRKRYPGATNLRGRDRRW